MPVMQGPAGGVVTTARRVVAGLAALAGVCALQAARPAEPVAVGGVSAEARTAAAQDGESPRLVVVIADLHLGAGRGADGAGRAAEDFRRGGAFARFLAAVDADGAGAADLVLNGDTFELAPPADQGCAHDDPEAGCTEAEALAQLDRVLAAHADTAAALAAFAQAGSNRVILVPGDHDAALLFPAVRARAAQALGAPAARAVVAASGAWTSDDGRIHVEHGHQLAGRAHRFAQWPAPFVERAGRRHLERPWGARVVTPRLRALAAAYPVVDHFADQGAGLTHGLAAAGAADLGADAPDLLRYVLFRMPWQQFRVDLDAGDVQPPRWDLAAVRAQGPAFLVASLPDDDRFRPAAQQALDAGRLDALMRRLGDDELIALCDYRAAVRRARRRFERPLTQIDPQGPPVAECPRQADSRGGRFDYFWRTRDLVYGARLEAAQAARPPGAPPIAVFVHGHTHLVDWRQRVLEMTRLGRPVIVDGFSPVRGALTPVVINGGAWRRTLTPVQFDRLRAAHDLSDDALLRALRPEHLAPCYSFVRIDPSADAPAPPAIRYWRSAADGGWEMADACGLAPALDPAP